MREGACLRGGLNRENMVLMNTIVRNYIIFANMTV